MLVGPARSGVHDSKGNELDIDELVDGGPSVLFDAVAVVLTEAGADAFAAMPPAKDFANDAHAHYKFVGCGPNATRFLDVVGIDQSMRDGGYLELGTTKKSATDFVKQCRQLRFWDRPGH